MAFKVCLHLKAIADHTELAQKQLAQGRNHIGLN